MTGIVRWVFGLAAVALGFAIGSASQARADAYSDHVAAIVEHGWRPHASAIETARQRHAAAVQLNAADSRADYALALVQMRRGDWQAATASLATASRKNRADLYAWRAHVWLLVYQRQFEAAMKEMTALADSFAAAPPTDASAQARRRAASKIMGRVAGYLAGPRQDDVDETALKQWQAALVVKLGKENSTAFADGQQAIAAEHQRLLDAIDAEKADTLAANQAEKDGDQEFVEAETARIETEGAQLEQLAAEAKNVLDEQTSQLDSELSPIQLSYADVEARARPFQLRIVELQSRLNSALAEVNIRDGERATDDERRRNRERREGAHAKLTDCGLNCGVKKSSCAPSWRRRSGCKRRPPSSNDGVRRPWRRIRRPTPGSMDRPARCNAPASCSRRRSGSWAAPSAAHPARSLPCEPS